MKTETATLTMRKTDKSGATSYSICGRSIYLNKGVVVGETMPPTLEMILPSGFAFAGPAEPKAPRAPLTPAERVAAAKAALAAAEKAAAAVATPPAPKAAAKAKGKK